MRAQRPDLLAGLELAKDAEADFASVCLLEDGLQCRAGEGDGQPYPLRDVLALCTRIALPLCLFVRECADEKALYYRAPFSSVKGVLPVLPEPAALLYRYYYNCCNILHP